MGAGASEPKKHVNDYPKRVSPYVAKKYTGDLFNQTTFDKHVTDDKRWMVGLIAGIDEKIEEVEELIAELREGAVTTKRNQEIADAEEEKDGDANAPEDDTTNGTPHADLFKTTLLDPLGSPD